MKKLFSIMLVMLMLIGILASCNKSNNETSSNTNNNTNISSNSDISSDSNNAGAVNPLESYEKYGNKVYFAFEEKESNYYAIVTVTNEDEELETSLDEKTEEENYENLGIPIEIPKDGKNYFKFIQTYEELTTYISSPNIDATVFETNYIVCIKENFYLSSGWERWFKHLGYSDFKLKDDKYEITTNFYFSVDAEAHLDIVAYVTTVDYLIIPKAEIDFVEGVHEIIINDNQINGDNGFWTDEILGGNPNPMPPSTNTHNYLTYNENTVLPNNPASWVVKKGSELEKQLGLENDSHSKFDYRVILYLPNEPKYDFIITEKEIRNGNLYLTIEEYLQYTNEYLKENDVKFYDLYIQDTSELADNFDVYITVKK